MTTLHLIRHGSNDALKAGRLAGRDWALGLNDEGRAQAERRAESLREVPLAAILCSPLPRCQETAAPLARLHGLEVETRDELIEVDFGAWTGLTDPEIGRDPAWPTYRAFRAGNAVPNGETLAEVRARVLRLAIEARARHPDGHVAIVSHGDPLSLLIMQVLGMPDDAIERLDLGPCVWAVLELGPTGGRLRHLAAI